MKKDMLQRLVDKFGFDKVREAGGLEVSTLAAYLARADYVAGAITQEKLDLISYRLKDRSYAKANYTK